MPAALPKPVPGLVIRYGYLWHREYLKGREEGAKDRPCAIVAALRIDQHGQTRVLALPITHAPTERAELAVEIPFVTKKRLGLDGAQSWVVLTEWNEFVRPGPDLRPVPQLADASVAYGVVPPALFAVIRERFLAIARAGAAGRVPRTE